MSPPARLRSLDVFRGLTVAAMIAVNSPGGDEVFAPLRHADWHGCTPADLIFPAFLVIMGVSAVFGDAARRERGETPAETARRVLRRAAVLLALGLLVNFFLYHGRDGLRLPGVLQRIALCGLAVEAFLRLDRPAAEPAAAAALLIGYQLLLGEDLTPEGNLAYRLDVRLFGGRLLDDPWGDPEGLTSTLGALATSLLGLMAGRRLVREGPAAAGALGAAGLALAALGAAWSARLPLNKHLWTSSYALFAGGLSLAGLAFCLRLVEARPARWARPFEALGRRALAAYVLAGLAYGIQEFVRTPLPDGSPGNLKLLVTVSLFGSWLRPKAASLAYALVFTGAAAAAAAVAARREPRAAVSRL
ncbi:MAG: DUF1624 domain-containing protein [Elusimicrobia bacterium]|nr:DUF1624 domain-containing protein [Elusimicrobiota bacterium]